MHSDSVMRCGFGAVRWGVIGMGMGMSAGVRCISWGTMGSGSMSRSASKMHSLGDEEDDAAQ